MRPQLKKSVSVSSFSVISLVTLLSILISPVFEYSQGQAIASSSWWDDIFGPKKGTGGSKSPFCSIFPSSEDPDLLTTFHTRPLFIWKNTLEYTATEVEVLERLQKGSDKEQIWSAKVQPNQQQISYGEVDPQAKPLIPGNSYFYRVLYKDSQGSNGQTDLIPFDVVAMPPDLAQRFEALGKNSNRKVALLEQLKLLRDENSWADLVQIIFSQTEPNVEITRITQKIRTQDFCSIKPMQNP